MLRVERARRCRPFPKTRGIGECPDCHGRRGDGFRFVPVERCLTCAGSGKFAAERCAASRPVSLRPVSETESAGVGIKLDLDRQVCDLDGNELESDKNHLGKTIAQRLAFLAPDQAKQANAPLMKVFEWAKVLNLKNPLNLDKADLELFEELLPHLGLVILVVGQVKDLIAEAKEAAKPKKAGAGAVTAEAKPVADAKA